jgi:Flp pilus assembly pilin Flp
MGTDMTVFIICDRLRRFWKQDSGAVTVDFVVLTALVVFLSLSIVTAILGDVTSVSERVSDVGTQFYD